MKIVDITPISVEISSEEAASIGGGIGYNPLSLRSFGKLGYEANGGGGGGSSGDSNGSSPGKTPTGGIRGLTITPTYQGFPQGLITKY